MKKNNYNKYIWIFLAVVIASCGKDDETILNEPSHRVIFTSEMDFENKVQVGGEMSFGDVSAGVVSRTWTFPANVVDIVDSENDLTSTEPNVRAIFNEVGIFDVRLNQVFSSEAYVDKQLRGKELDTTIVVTVLDFVSASIQANYINEDGSTGDPITLSSSAKNEITASRSIRFSYTAAGDPQNITWIFEGGDPGTLSSAQEEVDVKYKRLGTYDISFVASRSRPFGGDTISFKDLITVIPSTDPVDLEGITDKDGKIALVFSREMDATTLKADNFNVTIENKGEVINPAISKVSIDTEEGNIVLIELANESLYNDDIIKVSYTPGALSTADAVAATAFSDQELIFNKVNILASSAVDFGFENSSPTNWPYLWWGGHWGEYDLTISSERAYAGSKSAYIEFRPNGGMIIGHRDLNGVDNTFTVEHGKTYEMGVWIYVEDLGMNNPDAFVPDLRFYWGPATDWGVGGNPFFTADHPTNQWVYSSIFVKFGHSGDTKYMIRGYNENNSQTLKFYMDNLSVSEAVLRPI